MASGFALVDLGKLSEPVNTLIEKVSDAVGGLCKPWQIRRIAKAEAAAHLIQVETHIQSDEVRQRALARLAEEEAAKQTNMEAVVLKSIPHVSDAANPSGMQKDWIVNFFDKVRLISDDEMQETWARVLAGEANSPGEYSKRTVNFLASMDKKDAQSFQALCSFVWVYEASEKREFWPVVFDFGNKIYTSNGVDFELLAHLESIGLVKIGQGFSREDPEDNVTSRIMYGAQALEFSFCDLEGHQIHVGEVLLTSVGEQLAKVCSPQEIEGFYEYSKAKWELEGVKFKG